MITSRLASKDLTHVSKDPVKIPFANSKFFNSESSSFTDSESGGTTVGFGVEDASGAVGLPLAPAFL